MSADNGIYILETNCSKIHEDGKEYRICHAQGIDNIYFDEESKEHDEVTDHAMKAYWGKSKVFASRKIAYVRAFDLAKEYEILEYGVQVIVVNREFPKE